MRDLLGEFDSRVDEQFKAGGVIDGQMFKDNDKILSR